MIETTRGWFARLFSGGRKTHKPLAAALLNIMQTETRERDAGQKTAQVEKSVVSADNLPVDMGQENRQCAAVSPADRPQASISPPSKRSLVLGSAIAVAIVVPIAVFVAAKLFFTSYSQSPAPPQPGTSAAHSTTVSPVEPTNPGNKAVKGESSTTATAEPSSKAPTEVAATQSQQGGRAEVFRSQRASRPELPAGLISENIEVRSNGVGRCSIKILKGGNMAFYGKEIVPDALGSRNIHIVVEPGEGPTSFAGLNFKNSCLLNILADGSLEVDKEGIEASDDSAGQYVSQEVTHDNKKLMLMVRRPDGPGKQTEDNKPVSGTEGAERLPRFKGYLSPKMRGWVSPNNTLVGVVIPLPAADAVDLTAWELRKNGETMAKCIGVVPPNEFAGGVSGVCSDMRDNTPLPLGGLRPAEKVEDRRGNQNNNVQGFFFNVGVKNSLILGSELVLKSARFDTPYVTDPSVTYLLLSDGWHWTLKREKADALSGVKVPIGSELHLLFVGKGSGRSRLDLFCSGKRVGSVDLEERAELGVQVRRTVD